MSPRKQKSRERREHYAKLFKEKWQKIKSELKHYDFKAMTYEELVELSQAPHFCLLGYIAQKVCIKQLRIKKRNRVNCGLPSGK